MSKTNTNAIGLISGGLDSILAVKVIEEMGFNVTCLYFKMPWEGETNPHLVIIKEQIKSQILTIQLDNEYLDIVQNPQFGYGTAINPCIDCKIFMLKQATRFMKKLKADFIFTGEVLGQRPMSQMRNNLNRIEEFSGLKGLLLRPLSAQLLEPTIPEINGVVNRKKLLTISGRSRKEQIKLANKYGITEYKQPAGGCLLTDKSFSRRLKDFFQYDYKTYKDTRILTWGRHFRHNDKFRFIVGRNEAENNLLLKYANPNDTYLIIENKNGPLLLIRGENPSKNILAIAASLVCHFSKHNDDPSLDFSHYSLDNNLLCSFSRHDKLTKKQLENLSI